MDWHALFVETGKEELVRGLLYKHFDRSTMQAMIPKRRLYEKKQGEIYEVCRPLFPGYVFVNTRMTAPTYNKLKRIPKYYRLLNKYSRRDRQSIDNEQNDEEDRKAEEHFEAYLFSRIDEEEMLPILQLLDGEETIDYSTIYVENEKVIVHSGPLQGLEGNIKKIDKRKRRARILLNFMGTEKYLDVGIQWLERNE